MRLLAHAFFSRSTEVVARDLLGREIIRYIGSKRLRARIVETEAYLGKGDAASHSSHGPTPRSQVMFGPPGFIYVYFIYGNYFLLNFVTEKEGIGGAVLIRAVEPLEGLETMKRLRGAQVSLTDLTNGPAKLVLAFGIDGSFNKKALGLPHLAVSEGRPVQSKQIVATTRIGIREASHLPLRFYEKGNPFVSK